MESNREIKTGSPKETTPPKEKTPLQEAQSSKEGTPLREGTPRMEGSVSTRDDVSGRELLLRNNLAEIEKPNIYSLETEFAKTKKNHDFLFYLVFVGFILFLLGSTVGIASYLEAKSKQVNIDITDFEDLRLKETLTAAAQVEDELNQKTTELTNLQANYQTEVSKLQLEIQKRANNPQTADKKDLQKLLQQEKKRLETLQKQYDKQIAQKQAEVNKLQEQSQKKGLTNKDFERYYQLEMDRQKTFYQDQIAELKKSYESKLAELKNSNATEVANLQKQLQGREDELGKYGTIFNDEAMDELLNDLPKNVSGGDTLALKTYRKELSQEKVLERSAFNDIRNRINRFLSIDKRIKDLFKSNPAMPAIQYTSAVTNSLINDYEQLWWTLTDRVAEKNQTIDAYETTLYAALKEKDADGCVTDPQKRDQMRIFLRKNLKIQTETIVELYREKDEYVGKIKLVPTNAGIQAQVVELAKFKTVKPLDWFKMPNG